MPQINLPYAKYKPKIPQPYKKQQKNNYPYAKCQKAKPRKIRDKGKWGNVEGEGMDYCAGAAILGAGSRDQKAGRGWGCRGLAAVQYGAPYHHIDHRFTRIMINVLIFNSIINVLSAIAL